MGLKVTVMGAGDFHRLARALREAGSKDLGRELDKGIRRAADDVAQEIRKKSDMYMPKGYETVFKASLRFKAEVRSAFEHRITLVVSARGAKGHDRQVEELEAGLYRVPNWGRWRARRGVNRGRHKIRNKWHTQRVRAHFATEPAEGAKPQFIKRVDAAVAAVVEKIERAT